MAVKPDTMTAPTVLAGTWRDGLFVVTEKTVHQELTAQRVSGLAPDPCRGVLAIVNGTSLCRRAYDGKWSTISTSESELACCMTVGDSIFVGTDDALVLRVSAGGKLERLDGFDDVAGRATWYAGSALINGQRVGPPLGIRSMTATSDGRVLLANVHVGGIPRSVDGGVTWHPTIDIDSDVHQVCAHPTRPDIVIAAAAIGLCISRDGGATWTVKQEGLHAPYCSAVAFSGDDILVAASADHFATQGAIYRARIDGDSELLPVGGGLPRWINGIADTGCIATHSSGVAIADRAGSLYTSTDAGRTWAFRASCFPPPSSILFL